MRDMLGGFPVRDLDFTVEGPALKLAEGVAEKPARGRPEDDNRRSAELIFSGGVPCRLRCRGRRSTRTGRASRR